MLLIIIIAFLNSLNIWSVYHYSIICALSVSLIGDLFLLFPEKSFRKGLIAFLIAHLIFSWAFVQDIDNVYLYLLVPIFVFGVLMHGALQNNLGKLKIPVLVYLGVISAMGWLALNRHINFQDISSLLVAIGGILFIISDSILAINKFKFQFRSAEGLILSTYFTAQLLFALSLGNILI